MGISLETLALARKYVGKATSQMNEDIAGKGDTLDYDGATLTLKSGNKDLSSVSIAGGEAGYTMATDEEVEEMLAGILGDE